MSPISVCKNNTEQDRIHQLFSQWSRAPDTLHLDDVMQIMQKCLSFSKYTVTEKGLCIWLGDGENKNLHLITDTLILPIAEIRQHSVNGISRKLHLIGVRKGSMLGPVSLTPSELSNIPRWIRDAWGFKTWISPTISNATSYILDSIHLISDHIPTIDEYCYLGWTTNNQGKNIYITGSEILGTKGICQIYPDSSLKELSLPSSDITEKIAFRHVIDEILHIAPKEICNTAFSFTLLSLTMSAFKDEVYKPDFLYYLCGPSGSRKTSISKVFFNIYERFWDAVPINFTATQPAMELMMVKMRDNVVLIDDIAPSINATERSATEKKLESIVRAYGDTVGRQKMGMNNKSVDLTPSGLAAITAEDNIFKNPSSIARCFIAHIEKNDVNLTHLTEVQKNRGHYPTAIKYYITDISRQFSGYIESLKSSFIMSRHHFSKEHVDTHGRLINTAAWLEAAFTAYMQYGQRRGFLTSEEVDDYIHENRSHLHNWIITQGLLLKNNNEVDMFIYALIQLITSNRVRIQEIQVVDKQNKVLGAQGGATLIGYKDFDTLFLLPDVTYSEVRSFYAKQGIDYSFSQRSLLDRLCKRGILRPDNNKDGTKTVRITVNRQRISVIRLDHDAFRWWGEEHPMYRSNL